MSLTIDSNVMCFKQGNKPNEWWLASKIDVEFIEKLINVIAKHPDKTHKLQYINQKNELSFIEGNLKKCDKITIDKFNIVFYTANYKNSVRQIIITPLPKHSGMTNDIEDKESLSPRHNKILDRKKSKKKDTLSRHISLTRRKKTSNK